MSYEFNTKGQDFELPNPYKVENLATIVSAGFMFLSAIGILISVRGRLAHAPDGKALAIIAISVSLLALSIWLLARAFTQLRFFFGRNRPLDLAPGLSNGRDGDSKSAAEYKEVLRQSAILLAEPKGALNGLLYSWLPHLIFAPIVIQISAQTQFYNFLSLGVSFISFLLCWLLFGQSEASMWIGLLYGAFMFFQIAWPMMSRRKLTAGAINESANVGAGALIILIVAAVLGPVLLGMFSSKLPILPIGEVNIVVFVSMLCILLGSAIFGLALKSQLQPQPEVVGTARVVETFTMNAHPNKLLEELDRTLMERWFSDIPNRKYTRRSPNVSGSQGLFECEIFEETQPRPQKGRVAENILHALATQRFFWLTCLTGLATIYLVLGVIAAIVLTMEIASDSPVWTTLWFAISEFGVGLFCYRAAHVLWGRFDFVSELIWVDIAGSFETAKVNIGNQFSGNMQTSKNVINIESMTLRVWVSEIDTVIFNKDAGRQLIGMRGLPDFANELAGVMKNFGEQRSMVVAPTSAQDLERAQQIGVMNQLAGGPVSAQPPSPQQIAIDAAKSSAVAAAAAATNASNDASDTHDANQARHAQASPAVCKSCAYVLDVDARFCAGCGTAV